MHENSMTLMKTLLLRHARPVRGRSVLDVGSLDVNGSYREMVLGLCFASYRGLDIREGPNVDHVVPESGPWDVAPADVVISGQCLEHVRAPWRWIANVVSVTRPGGVIVVIAPWQHRMHNHPWDCWRVLPVGMQALLEEAGLDVLQVGTSLNDCYGVARWRL